MGNKIWVLILDDSEAYIPINIWSGKVKVNGLSSVFVRLFRQANTDANFSYKIGLWSLSIILFQCLCCSPSLLSISNLPDNRDAAILAVVLNLELGLCHPNPG